MKDVNWEWNDKQKNHVSILPVNTANVQTKYKTPIQSESSTTSSPVQSNNSNNESSPPSSSFGFPVETPPRKFRSLAEIYETCTFALIVVNPLSYEKAAKQNECENTMFEEMQAIERNSTWELVDAPEGNNIIGLKWVFRIKYYADGSVQQHKAWLVAKGCSQQEGIEFEGTFSPVA